MPDGALDEVQWGNWLIVARRLREERLAQERRNREFEAQFREAIRHQVLNEVAPYCEPVSNIPNPEDVVEFDA